MAAIALTQIQTFAKVSCRSGERHPLVGWNCRCTKFMCKAISIHIVVLHQLSVVHSIKLYYIQTPKSQIYIRCLWPNIRISYSIIFIMNNILKLFIFTRKQQHSNLNLVDWQCNSANLYITESWGPSTW